MPAHEDLITVKEKKKNILSRESLISFFSFFSSLKINKDSKKSEIPQASCEITNQDGLEIEKPLSELKFSSRGPRAHNEPANLKKHTSKPKKKTLQKFHQILQDKNGAQSFIAAPSPSTIPSSPMPCLLSPPPSSGFYTMCFFDSSPPSPSLVISLPQGAKVTISCGPQINESIQQRKLKPIAPISEKVTNDINLKWLLEKFSCPPKSSDFQTKLQKMYLNPEYCPLHECLLTSQFEHAKGLVYYHLCNLMKRLKDTSLIRNHFIKFLSKQDKEGNVPLNLAVKKSPDDLAQFLFYSGCLPYLKDGTEQGDDAIHIAARFGHPDLLRKFLGEPPQCHMMHSTNKKGVTPLEDAMRNIQNMDVLLDIVELSCKREAFVIDQAPQISLFDQVNDILQCGCLPKMNDDTLRSDTPLHIAVRFRHIDLAKQCLKRHNKCGMVNRFNSEGLTPLMLSLVFITDKELLTFVKIICQKEINFKLKFPPDKTVFHFAMEKRNLKVIEILLKTWKKQGDSNVLNTKDAFDRTVLHYLASVKEDELPEKALIQIAEKLLKNGASLKEKDYFERMPYQLTYSLKLHTALYPLSTLDVEDPLYESHCTGPCASHSTPYRF